MKIVYFVGLITTTGDLNNRRAKGNEILQHKFGTINLPFMGNSIIYSIMLNFSGLHLNDHGTTCLVNHFCYALVK